MKGSRVDTVTHKIFQWLILWMLFCTIVMLPVCISNQGDCIRIHFEPSETRLLWHHLLFKKQKEAMKKY